MKRFGHWPAEGSASFVEDWKEGSASAPPAVQKEESLPFLESPRRFGAARLEARFSTKRFSPTRPRRSASTCYSRPKRFVSSSGTLKEALPGVSLDKTVGRAISSERSASVLKNRERRSRLRERRNFGDDSGGSASDWRARKNPGPREALPAWGPVSSEALRPQRTENSTEGSASFPTPARQGERFVYRRLERAKRFGWLVQKKRFRPGGLASQGKRFGRP